MGSKWEKAGRKHSKMSKKIEASVCLCLPFACLGVLHMLFSCCQLFFFRICRFSSLSLMKNHPRWGMAWLFQLVFFWNIRTFGIFGSHSSIFLFQKSMVDWWSSADLRRYPLQSLWEGHLPTGRRTGQLSLLQFAHDHGDGGKRHAGRFGEIMGQTVVPWRNSGFIWDLYGFIWIYMDLYGFIWIYGIY